MVESIDISNTSQEDALTLEPSKDKVQGLETSQQDSDILGGDDGEDQQEDDQDYLMAWLTPATTCCYHQG